MLRHVGPSISECLPIFERRDAERDRDRTRCRLTAVHKSLVAQVHNFVLKYGYLIILYDGPDSQKTNLHKMR